MVETIEINEKYSNNWRTTLYSSLAIAAVTFLIYLNLDDVLWSGIIRLIAFISFSLSIFCMLKVLEGKKTFRLTMKNGSLHVYYLKNGDIVQEEKLKRDDIQSIYKVPSLIEFPFIDYTITLSSVYNFKVKFSDSEDASSLFRFGGRILTVDQQSSYRLEEYLKYYNLYSNS